MEGRGLGLKDKLMLGEASTIFTLLLASLLSSLLPLCSAQGINIPFGYLNGSCKGPDQWSKLHSDSKVCGDGKMQTPIALPGKRLQVSSGLGKLVGDIKSGPATLRFKGYIELKWKEDAGTLNINGTRYSLKSCQWHSPSEHTIDGSRYPVEQHLYHSSSDGKPSLESPSNLADMTPSFLRLERSQGLK